MDATSYLGINSSLRQLYVDDARPWLVGFSGDKDSTMLASLIVEVIAGIPDGQRKKPVAVLCTDTRVEIPARSSRNGLNRHPDLPRVWVSNPIEFLTTEEVWAYLLQKPNPWGGDNRPLYKLYANAFNGECPIQIDTSTPSCANSRFGCWTCAGAEWLRFGEQPLAAQS
jgi:3'-phosphoadenosine 5'-phosphosulfate sulfotransferase (PAPS reductase)/FAD synthetase